MCICARNRRRATLHAPLPILHNSYHIKLNKKEPTQQTQLGPVWVGQFTLNLSLLIIYNTHRTWQQGTTLQYLVRAMRVTVLDTTVTSRAYLAGHLYFLPRNITRTSFILMFWQLNCYCDAVQYHHYITQCQLKWWWKWQSRNTCWWFDYSQIYDVWQSVMKVLVQQRLQNVNFPKMTPLIPDSWWV